MQMFWSLRRLLKDFIDPERTQGKLAKPCWVVKLFGNQWPTFVYCFEGNSAGKHLHRVRPTFSSFTNIKYDLGGDWRPKCSTAVSLSLPE